VPGLRLPALALALALAAPAAAERPVPDLLTGHGGPVKSIEISADGSRALTASFDYSVILWDITEVNARILWRLLGHDGAVNDAAFLPGETAAVSVGDDGTLMIWDLATGAPAARIPGAPVKTLDVAVSPDGRLAAAARWDGTARLYDLAAAREIAVLEGHRGNVNAVAFAPDGATLYTAGYDGQILAWSLPEARLIRPVLRHGWGVNSLALLDADRLAFGALDGTAAILDIATGALTPLAATDTPIQSVRAARGGDRLGYSDTAGNIAVFDAQGAPIVDGPVAHGPVWDFAFVPDTGQILHVGLDDFAMRWQIAPPAVDPILSQSPRRFEITDSTDPGALEFQRKCSICHTLTPDDANRAGPTLHKLFGRKVGTVPGYPYSEALLASDIVWTETTVAQLFDEGPDVVLPGTKMPVQRLTSVTRRDDLIRFLKKATQSVE
jgi:cytochrome c